MTKSSTQCTNINWAEHATHEKEYMGTFHQYRRSERTLRAFSSLDRTPQLLARYTGIRVSDLDSAIWDGTAWKTKHSSACRRTMMMFNFTFRSCTKHLYHVITNFYKRVTLPLSTGVMNMESRLPAFIAK